MENKIKNIIMTLSFVLFMIAMVGGNPIRSEAKVKDGTYYFQPCMATKFQVKNNRLILKVSKASNNSGIIKKYDKDYKGYKLKVKASKNCKYILRNYDIFTGKSNSRNVKYADVKKLIVHDRSIYKKNENYTNVILDSIRICQTIFRIPGNIDYLLENHLTHGHSLSRIVVKNNQVIKIGYFNNKK